MRKWTPNEERKRKTHTTQAAVEKENKSEISDSVNLAGTWNDPKVELHCCFILKKISLLNDQLGVLL